MIPQVEKWGVVLAGHWNRTIFTPDFVNDKVFRTKESEILFTMPPMPGIIYRVARVQLEVLPDRLVFRPRGTTDGCLRSVEETSIAALETLLHTPVTAVGINFTFLEKTPSDSLLELFNAKDVAALFDHEWELVERRLSRKLSHKGQLLNLGFVLTGSEVTIDLNFHSDVTNTTAAASALRDRHIVLHNTAKKILEEVYQMRVEKTDDD